MFWGGFLVYWPLKKKAGRGWHGRTVKLEPALGFGNGSYRVTELLLKPKGRF